MRMPKISIIIPVYNAGEYLKQCLDSVLNQTFIDYECICVNDGSTDNSLSIIQEYVNKDSRFNIIDKKNEGVSISRNIGIDRSVGEYITFIDSDDWIEKDYLIKIFYNKNSKNDLVVCGFNVFNHKDNIIDLKYEEDKSNNKVFLIEYKNIENFLDFIGSYRSVWGKLYRSDIIKKNNIYFFNNISGDEDYAFNILYIMYIKNIIFMADKLYVYRKQVESLTSNDEQMRISSLYAIVELIKDLNIRRINNDYVFSFLFKTLFRCMGKISKNVSIDNKNKAFKTIKYIYEDMIDNHKENKSLYLKLKINLAILETFGINSFKIFRILKNII